MVNVTLRGHKYPALFDLQNVKEMQEHFGDLTALPEKLADPMEAAYIIWLMVREGVELDNEEHHRDDDGGQHQSKRREPRIVQIIGDAAKDIGFQRVDVDEITDVSHGQGILAINVEYLVLARENLRDDDDGEANDRRIDFGKDDVPENREGAGSFQFRRFDVGRIDVAHRVGIKKNVHAEAHDDVEEHHDPNLGGRLGQRVNFFRSEPLEEHFGDGIPNHIFEENAQNDGRKDLRQIQDGAEESACRLLLINIVRGKQGERLGNKEVDGHKNQRILQHVRILRERIPGCDEIIKSSKARHDSAHIIVQRIGLEGHDEGIDVDVNVEHEEMDDGDDHEREEEGEMLDFAFAPSSFFSVGNGGIHRNDPWVYLDMESQTDLLNLVLSKI